MVAAAALVASGGGPRPGEEVGAPRVPEVWDWTRIGSASQAQARAAGPGPPRSPSAAASQELRARLAGVHSAGSCAGGLSPGQAMQARAAPPSYPPATSHAGLSASLHATAQQRAVALAREAGAERARIAAAAMLRPHTLSPGEAATQGPPAAAPGGVPGLRPGVPPSIAGPRWVSPAEDTVCVGGLAGNAASGFPMEMLLKGFAGGTGGAPGAAEMVPRSAVLQLLDALRLVTPLCGPPLPQACC